MKKLFLLFFVSTLIISCEKEVEKIVYVKDNSNIVPSLISVSEDPVIFTPQSPSYQKVVLYKNDSTPLDISISNHPSWIYVNSPDSSFKQLLELYVSRSTNYNYPFGILNDSIEFVTILGKGYINVRFVNNDVDEIIVKDTVYINAFEDTASFQVFNNLKDSINISLNANSLFTITTSNSLIPSGGNTTVNLQVDRNALGDSTDFYDLNLNYNGKVKIITVKVENYKENKIKIHGEVIDSEFDKRNNKLIYVCKNPSKLVSFDPISKSKDSILLNRVPNCLSISKSGSYAVIGNDSYATLINLNSMSVINSFFTGAKAADIVLKDSSFAYVMPLLGSHINFRCFDLQNNYLFTYQTGRTTSANLRARLHPIHDVLYTLDNETNPEDIDKYDLSAGTADYAYDSPYHGTYPFGGDLWFSANGEKIITKGKVLVTSSPDSSLDMIYNGTISLHIPTEISNGRSDYYFHIRHTDSRISPNELLLSLDTHYPNSGPEMNKLFIYNADNLQLVRMISTESFARPNLSSGSYDFFPAKSYFSFYTSNPNVLVSIVKTEEQNFVEPWAIELINL